MIHCFKYIYYRKLKQESNLFVSIDGSLATLTVKDLGILIKCEFLRRRAMPQKDYDLA